MAVVLTALFVVPMVLLVVGAALGRFRPDAGGVWRRAVRDGPTVSEPDPTTPRQPPPSCLEGVLARQVVTGELAPEQYRRAMHRLAAREDRDRPLVVPPDPAGR